MERPCSTSRCSSQPRARCRTGFKRERRWQNSATNELDKGRSACCHVRDHDDEPGRIFLRHVLQPLHPDVGQIAIVPGAGQAGGDALQIFDQPSRSMIGMAQSSPSFRADTFW